MVRLRLSDTLQFVDVVGSGNAAKITSAQLEELRLPTIDKLKRVGHSEVEI